MEYWLRRGDAEYSFDAPEEASVYEAQPTFKPDDRLDEKLRKLEMIDNKGVIIVDLTYPIEPYIGVLNKVTRQDSTILLTTQRIGNIKKELNILEKFKNIFPSHEVYTAKEIKSFELVKNKKFIEFLEESKKIIYIYPTTPFNELILQKLDVLSFDFLDIWKSVQKISFEVHYIGVVPSPKNVLLDVSQEKIGCHHAYNVEIKNQFDCLIVSPGGSPFDDNFYQSLQSLYGIYQSVKKGGTIILTAECIDGIGPKEFIQLISLQNKNDVKQEKTSLAPSLGCLLLEFLDEFKKNARIYLVSPIPRIIMQRFFGFRVFDTLQEAVQQAVRLHNRALSICSVPYGTFTRLTVAKEASQAISQM